MKKFLNPKTIFVNLGLAATLAVATSSAFAHVHLESASPSINATISAQPKNIVLNFAEPTMLMGFKLLDAKGQEVAVNYTPSQDMKKTFSIPVGKLAKGKYTVNWGGMAMDGHNMNSNYNFTIQ